MATVDDVYNLLTDSSYGSLNAKLDAILAALDTGGAVTVGHLVAGELGSDYAGTRARVIGIWGSVHLDAGSMRGWGWPDGSLEGLSWQEFLTSADNHFPDDDFSDPANGPQPIILEIWRVLRKIEAAVSKTWVATP